MKKRSMVKTLTKMTFDSGRVENWQSPMRYVPKCPIEEIKKLST
jgi:hypothetical protein